MPPRCGGSYGRGHAFPPALSDALVELHDVFATLAEITEAPLATDSAEASFRFLPALTGSAASGPRRIFSVHHSLAGVFALREGPWKFGPSRGSGGFSAPKTVKVKDGEPTPQLYRMESDLAATRNVAGEETAVTERLAARLRELQKSTRTRP